MSMLSTIISVILVCFAFCLVMFFIIGLCSANKINDPEYIKRSDDEQMEYLRNYTEKKKNKMMQKSKSSYDNVNM